jgi:hypothetical protein
MYKQDAGRIQSAELIHRIALWPGKEQWLLCCAFNGNVFRFTSSPAYIPFDTMQFMQFMVVNLEYVDKRKGIEKM